MTGILRGKTLEEKVYGPGFRDTPYLTAEAPWPGCGVEGCSDPIYGSCELYVDEQPPIMDWYTRLLSRLPSRVWSRVKFCQNHLADVTQRSTDDLWDGPDLWAPWRASPPVLMHPPKLLTPKTVKPSGR